MPASEIDALFGGDDPSVRMKMLSAALANQQKMGLAGIASGDQAIGAAGAGLFNSANQQSANVARNNLNDLYRKYQEDVIAAQAARAEADRRSRENEGRLNRQNRLDAANVRAASQNTPHGHIPSADRKVLGQTTDVLQAVNSLLDNAQAAKEKGIDLGNEPAKNIPIVGPLLKSAGMGDAKVPYSRGLENWAANTFESGYVSDTGRQKSEFWRNAEALYALGARNTMFGATLAPHEQALWESANPNKANTMEQLVSSLQTMQQIAKDHHQRITSNLQASYGESATTGYEEPENVQMPEMRKLLGGTPTQQEQPQGSGLITRQPGLGVGQPGGENVLGRTPVGSAVVPRVQVIIDPATGQPTFKRTR